MKTKRFDLITDPALVTSVALLLINDYYFKRVFPGFVSGKVSDFAGLFAFSLFWFAMFPMRRAFIAVTIVGLFAFWKSPYSDSLIDAVNQLGHFRIGRTVDYWDLAATAMLLPAFLLSQKQPRRSHCRWRTAGMISICAFSFLGTSVINPKLQEYIENTFSAYRFDKTAAFELNLSKRRVETLLMDHFSVSYLYVGGSFFRAGQKLFWVTPKRRCCYDGFQGVMSASCDRFDWAEFELTEENDKTIVMLSQIKVCDLPDKYGEFLAAKVFEKSVLGTIKADPRSLRD